MGHPAEKLHRATYADLEAVPPHQVAELIQGTLYVFPRPAPRHTSTHSALGMQLGPPFRFGQGGPGGWWILAEPELHLGGDTLVPDLAGWRVERMPDLPETAFFPLAPDWICEVTSPSTAAIDRAKKMPVYAREGIKHLWLVDPIERLLEIFALTPEGQWLLLGVHYDDAKVRAVPFDAIELDLATLWNKPAPPAGSSTT